MTFDTLEDFLNTYKIQNLGPQLIAPNYRLNAQPSYKVLPTTNFFSAPNYSQFLVQEARQYWNTSTTTTAKTNEYTTTTTNKTQHDVLKQQAKQSFMYTTKGLMNYEQGSSNKQV